MVPIYKRPSSSPFPQPLLFNAEKNHEKIQTTNFAKPNLITMLLIREELKPILRVQTIFIVVFLNFSLKKKSMCACVCDTDDKVYEKKGGQK